MKHSVHEASELQRQRTEKHNHEKVVAVHMHTGTAVIRVVVGPCAVTALTASKYEQSARYLEHDIAWIGKSECTCLIMLHWQLL